MKQQEGRMNNQINSLVEMMKQFGTDLGLPKLDVEKLVEINRKNLDALSESAQVFSGGAKALATKQKDFVTSTFQDAVNTVRDFKPTGNPAEVLTKQAEFAKKAFDAALTNTRDSADLIKQSNVDALKIVGDRIKESVVELRATFERDSSGTDKS
jgi:phasin family protein